MMGIRECLIEGRASAKALRWKLAEAKSRRSVGDRGEVFFDKVREE